jgi:NitT/TauT family transport system ATP-binding protein
VLNVDDLRFGYSGLDRAPSDLVFRDFSLEAREGEFVSVVGPSGCGKTTLLLLIAGLLRPQAGRIEIDAGPVRRDRGQSAIVFQQPSLLPWRTALDNVAWGLTLKGASPAEARRQAIESLRLVGLDDFASRYPNQLSGGMQQRINLARALAVDPRILLMDEPFASLDAQTREVMQDYLLFIWSQRRKTVVFVTHQIDEAVLLADRVVVISRGGTTLDDIAIAFARPRVRTLRKDRTFGETTDHIWGLLEKEVLSSRELIGVRLT